MTPAVVVRERPDDGGVMRPAGAAAARGSGRVTLRLRRRRARMRGVFLLYAHRPRRG